MNYVNKIDPEISSLLQEEEKREKEVLEMIPSENYTSSAVREALSSVITNKYSEGYPKKRYYQGNRLADEIELLAIERAKKLFGVAHVNVQPYSGSPANTAIYFALLNPLKDKIMGLNLAHGGHLTHGSPVSFSGKYFKTVSYELDKKGLLDYKKIEEIAKAQKPKIIVCGATAYPRIIDFKKFGEIADSINAYLLADVSHIAGLIAGGAHPSPVPFAHIVMTTTHKTLRGPRGAIIMTTKRGNAKDDLLAQKIDKAVFPGLQGGPHDNQTAAIAVALHEAQSKNFSKYAHQIVKNAAVLAGELLKYDFTLISGGTDNHLLLIDLRSKNANGAIAAYALEVAGIVVNKNSVPNDTMPPFYPSGIRLGTPAITTRGLQEKDMIKVAKWINEAINEVVDKKLPEPKEERSRFFKQIKKDLLRNKKLLSIQKEVKNFAVRLYFP